MDKTDGACEYMTQLDGCEFEPVFRTYWVVYASVCIIQTVILWVQIRNFYHRSSTVGPHLKSAQRKMSVLMAILVYLLTRILWVACLLLFERAVPSWMIKGLNGGPSVLLSFVALQRVKTWTETVQQMFKLKTSQLDSRLHLFSKILLVYSIFPLPFLLVSGLESNYYAPGELAPTWMRAAFVGYGSVPVGVVVVLCYSGVRLASALDTLAKSITGISAAADVMVVNGAADGIWKVVWVCAICGPLLSLPLLAYAFLAPYINTNLVFALTFYTFAFPGTSFMLVYEQVLTAHYGRSRMVMYNDLRADQIQEVSSLVESDGPHYVTLPAPPIDDILMQDGHKENFNTPGHTP